MPGRIPPITIPDDFTVFVASDLHGQLAAASRLFAAAGLADGGGRWIAPPRTALVITGDVVDRGPDSLGLARRLASLRTQAETMGCRVALLEGNHEAQVLGGLDAVPQIFRAFLLFGGAATLLSAGLTEDDWAGQPAVVIADRLDRAAPDLRPLLRSFAPYATWRDVLLVHGGPVPHQTLDEFEASSRRLWIRADFFSAGEAFPAGESWRAFREAGIRRVVFGHTSVTEPTFCHDGLGLNIDTWRGQQVTLVRLPDGPTLEGAEFFNEPSEPRRVKDGPVSAQDILELDAGLPPVVDAHWLRARGPR